jgi:hypothetical protein
MSVIDKLPVLPKAEGVDLQYRIQLIQIARIGSMMLDKYPKWQFWNRHKRRLGEKAIFDSYNALKGEL